MKRCLQLIILLLFATSHLTAKDNGTKISFKKYTHEEILRAGKLSAWSQIDPGADKTIVSFENIPKEKEYLIKVARETLGEKKPSVVSKFSGEEGYARAEHLGCAHPVFCVSSLGYLPGEEIVCYLAKENEKGDKKFTLTPNPLEWHSSKDKASIEIKLASINPPMYSIHFRNFPINEEIKFISISQNEKIESQIAVEKNMKILHMPAVIGCRGGVNDCRFERRNKEIVDFELPWGTEFVSILQTGKLSSR